MNDTNKIAAEAARWAADDGLWTTQETVEANLIRFAQSVIKKATEQKDHEIEILRRDIDDKARVIESRAAHASEDTRRLDWIEANHHRFVTGNLPVTRKGIDAKMNKENAAHASESNNWGKCVICGQEHDLVNDAVHPERKEGESSCPITKSKQQDKSLGSKAAPTFDPKGAAHVIGKKPCKQCGVFNWEDFKECSHCGAEPEHASEEAEAQDIRNTETPYPRAAHASDDLFWDEKYVDERLGRDASWPQIIDAANHSIRAAIEKAYKQGRKDRERDIYGCVLSVNHEGSHVAPGPASEMRGVNKRRRHLD